MLSISLVAWKLELGDEWPTGVALVWMAAWTFSAIRLSRIRCPACHESFFVKRGIGNVWSNTCRHCRSRAPR
jgi:hypothetical protein